MRPTAIVAALRSASGDLARRSATSTKALLVLGLATTLGAGADARPPGGSEPTVVRLDAIASDARGRAVDNLRAEDFEVLEDGVSQPIDSVRYLKADGAAPAGELPTAIRTLADERAEAGREGTRVFAIILDEFHVTPGPGVARAREALTRFVTEDLGPFDLVLVVKPLDSLLALRVTRDREQVLARIASFDGRKGQYEPRTAFERNFIAGTPARIEQIRTQIATSALNAVTLHVGSLGSTRKAVLFVSEGFTRSPRRPDSSLPTFDSVVRAANRANVSVYPYDPSDPQEPASGDLEALRTLAQVTEGRAIVGGGDPADALRRMLADSSGYYVIAFRSAHTDPDGKFHAVDVRTRRSGVELRARNGYWATSAEDLARARLLSRASEPKAPPEPPRRTSPLIRPWFGVARGDPGQVQVSFVWEPAGRIFGDRATPVTPARIVLKATKPDGTPVFEGAVRSSGFGAAGVDDDPTRLVFETQPGRLKVQMSIEDTALRLVDTDVRDVIVNALASPVSLGTAEVFRARTARDFRSLESDPAAAPVAAREFSRTERLLIRVPAYAPDGAPAVTARLMNKLGSPMRELTVGEAPKANLYQIDLPLAGLAAGEYSVQFVAKSPAGESRDDLPFRVTQ
jgi:VWFA-related protein